jgi:hypothetical protein
VRNEPTDNLPLTAPKPHRLARAFLLEHQIGAELTACFIVWKVRKPLENLFERVKGIGKLTEPAGPIGGAPAVVDRFTPRFRATVVAGQERGLFVETLRMMSLDCPADRFMKGFALVGEKALVADLLRQHVCETVAGSRALAGRANEAGSQEPGNRWSKIDIRSQDVSEQRMLELPPERGRDPDHLSRLRLEVVEARSNDGLNSIGQRQGLRSAFNHGLARARRHGSLLDKRTAHLLEKEWIAPGPLEDAHGEPLRHASRAQTGFDDRRRAALSCPGPATDRARPAPVWL